MNLQKAKQAVLNELYQVYLENPTAICDLTEVIKEQEYDPHEFGKYLVDHEWVRNHQYRPTKFVGQITIRGINEVAPEYIKENTDSIVSGLAEHGRQGIMEILEWLPEHFQRAHDFAKYLEGTRLIKKPLYTHNEVILELSLEGQDYYNRNKAEFF